MTDARLTTMKKVLEYRTKHIAVVLEDIYQSQNASAVLRSSDLFGIHDIHIIENKNDYNINPDVSLGSSNWLNLHKYNEEKNNTLSCINSLKEKGYKVVATSPHKNDFSITTLPLDQPVALMFGTEQEGLSDIALNNADMFVRIPMYGFTESFNISVSAALTMYELTKRLHESEINWKLSEEDYEDIMLEWIKYSIKKPELIIERFFTGRSSR